MINLFLLTINFLFEAIDLSNVFQLYIITCEFFSHKKLLKGNKHFNFNKRFTKKYLEILCLKNRLEIR